MARPLARAAVVAALGFSLAGGWALDASAQRGGTPAPRGGNTKTNGDLNQILNQWMNGVVNQESQGVNSQNGLGNISNLGKGPVIWIDQPEATTLSPSPTAAQTAAAYQAAFDAMDKITNADLTQNIDVNDFVGEGPDVSSNGSVIDSQDADELAVEALSAEVSQALASGAENTDLAGDEDMSGGQANFAPIYAGYNLNGGGLTVTSLDLFPPMPSDVMTSLDLQPALCGR
jgi:hypothetical protein